MLSSKKSKSDANTQETGYKKRIKQKSLSVIFAKRLKEANSSVIRNLQQPQIPSQGKGVTAKAVESEKIKQSDATNKKGVKSDRIPSTANSDSTNASTVSFTKTTKEHVGRVLLAKKRNDSKDEPKRSLSNILSSQLKNQTESDNINLTQNRDIPKGNFKSDKKHKVVAKESPVSKYTKGTDTLNKKKEKKYKRKIVNNDKESDSALKLMHRAGGKISSLFGNNPDVPTIGQRFVKPVNEPVFTEITFADLNIHPFMVSICVLILTFAIKTFATK